LERTQLAAWRKPSTQGESLHTTLVAVCMILHAHDQSMAAAMSAAARTKVQLTFFVGYKGGEICLAGHAQQSSESTASLLHPQALCYQAQTATRYRRCAVCCLWALLQQLTPEQ
jgi:hypothetical protein